MYDNNGRPVHIYFLRINAKLFYKDFYEKFLIPFLHVTAALKTKLNILKKIYIYTIYPKIDKRKNIRYINIFLSEYIVVIRPILLPRNDARRNEKKRPKFTWW